MADLTAIIEGAVAEVQDTGEGDSDASSDSSDTGSSVDAGTSESGISGEQSKSGENVSDRTGENGDSISNSGTPAETGNTDEQPAATTPVLDDVDKALEVEGIKRTTGERENRIPYSRVRKIVQNTEKRLKTEFETKETSRQAEFTGYKTKADQLAVVDKLIAADPDRYIRTLALLHPGKYDKFLNPTPAEKVQEADPNEGKPQPDYEFADGSPGYTAAQHQKLLDWHADKARKAAVDEVTKRFKPLEDKFKSEQAIEQFKPAVNAQLDRARKTWGPLFDEDYRKAGEGKSEILAFMQENPDVPFADAVALVLNPKQQSKLTTDRTKIREEVMAELNARPRAAAKVVPNASKPDTSGSSDNKSLEDIIRESIAGLE